MRSRTAPTASDFSYVPGIGSTSIDSSSASGRSRAVRAGRSRALVAAALVAKGATNRRTYSQHLLECFEQRRSPVPKHPFHRCRVASISTSEPSVQDCDVRVRDLNSHHCRRNGRHVAVRTHLHDDQFRQPRLQDETRSVFHQYSGKSSLRPEVLKHIHYSPAGDVGAEPCLGDCGEYLIQAASQEVRLTRIVFIEGGTRNTSGGGDLRRRDGVIAFLKQQLGKCVAERCAGAKGSRVRHLALSATTGQARRFVRQVGWNSS